MKKLFRFLIALVGTGLFIGGFLLVERFNLLPEMRGNLRTGLFIGAGITGFLLAFLLAPRLTSMIRRSMDSFTGQMEKVPLMDIIFGTIGLLIGLIIAGLISNPILQLSISHLGNFLGVAISVAIYIVLGLLGIRLAVRSKDEIIAGLTGLKEDIISRGTRSAEGKVKNKNKRSWGHSPVEDTGELLVPAPESPKILDTSVIIDGRIFEVIKVGFIEGPYVISNYVLEELQHISDSADGLRRERGRKGLDSINELQQIRKNDVVVDNTIIDEVKEVDAKLLVLTKQYGGKIVTNDYNLNKVATVQDIPVLNVNDLANALKPIVIPGELMEVNIIKEGKEPEQGLGYLDDGTMIVVENGRNYIGRTVMTTVTSVLQTSAGKMIFTRI